LLDDFPTTRLVETIPGFHNTRQRYETFLQVAEADAHHRAEGVQAEIDFLMRRAADMPVLVEGLEQGILPERVTHNDTKFNNVMLDSQTGKAICVVDLDTVMPGLALYDFGDAIRSITNTAEEDERDLSKVHFDLGTFRIFTNGYAAATRKILTEKEIELLPFSAKLITMEIGMRFLTDHLDGDNYFKVHHPGHNLDRCRTQFRLVEEMEEQMDAMTEIVDLFFRGYVSL
jgi:Ser/Thr protein kinase RdoA (MazF antagonist)